MDMNQESEMSLVGHLTELRTRIIICLIALFISVVGSLFFAKPILNVLTAPIDRLSQEPGRDRVIQLIRSNTDGTLRISDPRSANVSLEQISQKRFEIILPADPSRNLTTATLHFGGKATQSLYYNNPMDPFVMMMMVALIAGIIIALPILLWQIWMFVKPGLKMKEQKIIKPMLGGAVILFPLGAAFAYFMIGLILRVMQAYGVENVIPLLNVYGYTSLLFNMMLIFGVVFEVPLALAIASRIGLVTPEFLKRYRRHAYVFMAIGAMVITPGGDPISMVAALGPLVALYEISIAISIPMARLHKQDQDEDEEAKTGDDEWENEDSEEESSPKTLVAETPAEHHGYGGEYPDSYGYLDDGNSDGENSGGEDDERVGEVSGGEGETSPAAVAATPEEETPEEAQPRYWWPDASLNPTSEPDGKPEEPKS